MTKEREPLSIDAALARIAGHVPGSWKAMAAEVKRSEFTVRKWGDEASKRQITVKAMIVLDLLYEREGGTGYPLHQAYGHLLNVAVADRYVSQFEFLGRIADIVKETGDAESALMRLAMPGATEADRRKAVGEMIEAVDHFNSLLPLLERLPVSGGDPASLPP